MNAQPAKILDSDFKSALQRLASDEVSLAPSVLFGFSDMTRAELQQFATVWLTLAADKRRRIVVAMSELAEVRFEADFDRVFRYLFDDDDAQVRAGAIQGLWEDENPALIRPLIGALRSDPSAVVRAAAAEALGRFLLLAETKRIPAANGDEIETALLAAIRNSGEDQLVHRRAIESIAYLGNEMVRNIVSIAYGDDDSKMRASAIFAMGRSADAYWKRIVVQELYSPDPQLRFEAARAIGELEFKAAVPRLIDLLEDDDREVQSAAITSLGQLGGKDARQALIAVMAGLDEVARELAQDALDELEFSSGSNLLLVDIGLESEEEALLDEEFARDEMEQEGLEDSDDDLDERHDLVERHDLDDLDEDEDEDEDDLDA